MQLRNLINRCNISAKMNVSGHVNEAEDFLRLVVRCYMVTAVMHHFGMKNLTDSPTRNTLSISETASSADKWEWLQAQLRVVVDTYIVPRQLQVAHCDNNSAHQFVHGTGGFNPHTNRINTEHSYHQSQLEALPSCSRELPSSLAVQQPLVPSVSIRRVARDGVFDYGSAVLNDGMLLFEFEDAIREGDGERILRCWKALLIYFHAAGHSNYTKEAIMLQALVKASATPMVSAQLTWSRTVSIRGGSGKNVPVDLHNEHLNRLVKTAVAHVGANVTPAAILQCGKSVKCLKTFLDNFDKEHNVAPASNAHSQASLRKDESAIMDVLTKTNVFDYIPGRIHESFKDIAVNPSEKLNLSKLCDTIEKYKEELQRKANVARLYKHSF